MEGKRIIFNTAFIVNICQFILLFVSFSSPYWFQSWPRVYSPFKRLGLWEACFAGLVLEVDPRQRAYHGCWWILSPEYDDIRQWLMPHWFIVCQLLTTVVFTLSFINLIIMLYIWMASSNNRNGKSQRNPSICAIQTSTVFTIISAVSMIVVCLLFGIMPFYDYYWMPHPELNYLSWAYGLACVSTFFSTFAGIAQIVHTRIVRDEMRKPRAPMMMTQMAHPPHPVQMGHPPQPIQMGHPPHPIHPTKDSSL